MVIIIYLIACLVIGVIMWLLNFTWEIRLVISILVGLIGVIGFYLEKEQVKLEKRIEELESKE